MPIAYREMLVLARSPAAYRARMMTGLGSLVAGAGFAVIYSRAGIGSTQQFIGGISQALSLMCIFMGANLTSDSVAREKREGTLSLLFLTHLSAFQITAGKLIAHGLSAFFTLFVTFPLLSLLMIVGGIGPAQVGTVAVSLANTLFLTTCIGLFVSTLSLDQKRAAGWSTSVVMLLWWGVPLLAQLILILKGPLWVSQGLRLFSLNAPFFFAFGPAIGTAGGPWPNILCLHLTGWFFLGLATLCLRHRWQDKPAGSTASLQGWWKRLSFGSPAARKRLRDRLLDSNAFLWLASRDRLRQINLWVATVVLLLTAAWVYRMNNYEWAPLLGFAFLLNFIHQMMAAGGGAAQLLAEQDQGTLEMLISTPLSTKEIIQGQLRAAFRQFRFPIFLVAALHVALLALLRLADAPGAALYAVVLALVFYLFGLYTAFRLAIWGVVTTQNARKAGSAAAMRLIGVPALTILGGTAVIALANLIFGTNLTPTFPWIIGGFCPLVLLNNGYWIRRTRHELPARLALYAFRRYEPHEPVGLAGRIGGLAGALYRKMRYPNSRPNLARTS